MLTLLQKVNNPREFPVSDISTGTRTIPTYLNALKQVATLLGAGLEFNAAFEAELDEDMIYIIIVAEARNSEPSTSMWSSASVSDVGQDKSEIYSVLKEIGFRDDIYENIRVSIPFVSQLLDIELNACRDHI